MEKLQAQTISNLVKSLQGISFDPVRCAELSAEVEALVKAVDSLGVNYEFDSEPSDFHRYIEGWQEK